LEVCPTKVGVETRFTVSTEKRVLFVVANSISGIGPLIIL
jgi:hypothetical protein